MDIGDAIHSLLASDTAVAAAIGTFNGKPNIFPDLVPRGVGSAAYIVHKLPSDREDAHLAGDSNFAISRVQIDCVASSYAAAKAIRDAVVAVLQAYRSPCVNGVPTPSAGVWIQCCLIDSQHRFVEPSVEDENLSSFGRSIDFTISHSGPA